MADVANMHRDYVLYLTRHTPQSVVEAVETASSARGLLDVAERTAAGYRTGRALVFTDLCVFRLDQDTGGLVVVETMPGVTRDDIRAQTGFAVTFDADCRPVSLPQPDVLDVLRRRIDPLGLRRLEFVGARERSALIAEILEADHALVERLAALSEPPILNGAAT
jgi:glutaconate CoA-transferase, subunit A